MRSTVCRVRLHLPLARDTGSLRIALGWAETGAALALFKGDAKRACIPGERNTEPHPTNS